MNPSATTNPSSAPGKISLCLIVGNAEEYIQRCLTTFAQVADEWVIVRAVGNQTPDRTVIIAEELARLHGIPLRLGEYKNHPDHQDWPHVDNFAAARQMSFDLAAHEYCFWCDTDDVLKAGAELIRAHAARAEFDCYLFSYEIFGRGINLPRERLVRKSVCRWVHRVHECLEFFPKDGNVQPPSGAARYAVKAGQDDAVVVLHLPRDEKTGSHPRNLRILRSIPEAEMTTGLYFHLHEELTIAGQIEEAVAVAKKILEQPDLGRPEKMDLFLNLAASTKDPQLVHDFLIQAYAADPRRREPLAHLCNLMLAYDHPDFALAFARQMLSIPEPPRERQKWNHRSLFYGWLGEDLYAQALRQAGHPQAAEQVRRAEMERHGGPRIALLHATRGRPAQAIAARKLWLEHAAKPERVEHIFVFDGDDEPSRPLRRYHHMELPPGGGCVAAWNAGAFMTTAPVLIQMSDDWLPPQNWDDLVLEKIGDETLPRVLAVSDGARRDALLCMAICTRNYFEQDYFLLHPWFTGVYSDNWFTEEAYRRNAVIEARDLVFQHQHPAFGSAPVDETYARQNAPERYAEGERIINRLRQGNDFSTVPGYCNFWPFYQHLARLAQDGEAFCEIGVWLGRSTIFLAQELQRLGKTKCRIYAVDTFQGEAGEVEHEVTVARYGGSIRGEFERNLKRCGVADMVAILEGDSAAMAGHVPDGTLRAVFVDAAHDYASVKADVAAWAPKLKPGGTMSGHDAQWHEVTKAATDVLGEIQVLGGIWMKEMK